MPPSPNTRKARSKRIGGISKACWIRHCRDPRHGPLRSGVPPPCPGVTGSVGSGWQPDLQEVVRVVAAAPSNTPNTKETL